MPGNVLGINDGLTLPLSEIEMRSIRASGPGGQHVNKVATAIHLRFEVGASSLPEEIRQKILGIQDQYLSTDGVIVIKVQKFRTSGRNRQEALDRLRAFILEAIDEDKPRKPTRPSRAAVQKRLTAKKIRGARKRTRKPIRHSGPD